MVEAVRLDKFLWCVRLFKSRTIAAEACDSHKVTLNGGSAKASRIVKIGDIIELRRGMDRLKYKIIALLDKRVGAPLVPQYIEDLIPAHEREQINIERAAAFIQRDKGAGRPTKKERRSMEQMFSNYYEDND